MSELWDDISKLEAKGSNYPNLSRDERDALKSLASDKDIVIKSADKGSAVVVWDREDYLAEAKRQLEDINAYKSFKKSDSRIPEIVRDSNAYINDLFRKGLIHKKEREFLNWELLHSPNYAKLYLLPKIHKRLYNVPGRPVISNCGAATEKISAFLDLQLKPIMQAGKSYLKDTDDFLMKIKQLGPIPDGAILVTADVIGLYPNIPHEDGLNALKETINKHQELSINIKYQLKF